MDIPNPANTESVLVEDLLAAVQVDVMKLALYMCSPMVLIIVYSCVEKKSNNLSMQWQKNLIFFSIFAKAYLSYMRRVCIILNQRKVQTMSKKNSCIDFVLAKAFINN